MGQALPHAPQFNGSLLTSSSQPSAQRPLQLPQPDAQASEHAPLAHEEVAWGTVVQTLPHAPQLSGSAVTGTSHPSPMIPLQSSQPASQAIEHTPTLHDGVAWEPANVQAFPQVPQLRGSEPVLISQPSLATPLQSVQPGLQAEPQTPPVQVRTECGGAVQSVVHVPQCSGSASRFASQPSAASPLQSDHPTRQP
jgi:hypothetical protein